MPKKPTLVLIHGLRGAPIGLQAVADQLRAQGYEVVTPAVPPFAGAKLPKEHQSYTPDAYADFLFGFIKTNQLERPILIGHSMGSMVVAATLAKYPELMNQKIIFLSPISAKPGKLFAFLSPLSAVLPRQVIDYITTKFLFVPKDRALFQTALKKTHACSSDHPPRPRDVYAAAKFSVQYSIPDLLNLQNSATRQKFVQNFTFSIISGSNDRLVPVKSTKKLARILQTEPIFIPNSGHLHNYEAPDATASAILAALKTPKA